MMRDHIAQFAAVATTNANDASANDGDDSTATTTIEAMTTTSNDIITDEDQKASNDTTISNESSTDEGEEITDAASTTPFGTSHDHVEDNSTLLEHTRLVALMPPSPARDEAMAEFAEVALYRGRRSLWRSSQGQ